MSMNRSRVQFRENIFPGICSSFDYLTPPPMALAISADVLRSLSHVEVQSSWFSQVARNKLKPAKRRASRLDCTASGLCACHLSHDTTGVGAVLIAQMAARAAPNSGSLTYGSSLFASIGEHR